MEDNFTLCQGVSVGGAEKLRSCCHIQGDNIRGVLSCDIMAKVACGVIEGSLNLYSSFWSFLTAREMDTRPIILITARKRSPLL